MNNFIIYTIETAICLTLFYSAYWIFLKKETYFKLNRFYLLFSAAVSLLLPLLNISITGGTENSIIGKYLVLPFEQLENGILAKMDPEKQFFRKGTHTLSPRAETNTKVFGEGRGSLLQNNSEIAPLNGFADKKVNWITIAMVIYFIGAGLVLIRFMANFIWIMRHIRKHRPQLVTGMKVTRLEKNISPFSFLDIIFIDHQEYPEAEFNKIIAHEKVHIAQKHSIDLILFELLLAFQWFNPAVWLYRRAVKINHEYLADKGTLNTGVDLTGYQCSLLNQVLRENNFEMASTYNSAVKKRIAMMVRKRSSGAAMLKPVIALPVIVFLFGAFAINTQTLQQENSVNSHTQNEVKLKDSTIKRIDVPVAYLKLLEGEYLSTNEPNRLRKIIFTEVLGNLFGSDNGYTYKLVPVGNGKFINPDDGVSLIFDTKDKDAITLLLAGRIRLNKGTIAQGELVNRSMAFSLLHDVLRNGAGDAPSYYKSIRDSANYYLTETELNLAGYELLQIGKAREAAALFKLNTEIFPNSFNTYDSYGEALLQLGEKTMAIQNYIKSVQLNPGSKSGIKVLKQLGINTDTIIKTEKVSKEYLETLAGNYVSTNQPNWVRWIRFEQEKGVLYGNDNGYRYSLIPVGNGKFINPDDGASLVFDTHDKNAITLLLFGKISLKKVKLSSDAADLKKYAGVYLPSERDKVLTSMELVYSNNKLFRFIETEPQPSNRNVELQRVAENTFFYMDRSARSIEFIEDDKKVVIGCLLKRPDGIYRLTKQK
jgi:hypothetical protein